MVTPSVAPTLSVNVSRQKPKTYKPLVKISRPLVKKYKPLVNVSRSADIPLVSPIGATLGATYLEKMCTDFQIVKCQV